MKEQSKATLTAILSLSPVVAIVMVYYFTLTPPIPDRLIGVWVTAVPKYETCFFEIQKDAIIFENGKTVVTSGRIASHTEAEVEDNVLLYTIFYKNDRIHKQQFSFYYETSDQGTVRFKNQREIKWKKRKQ